MTPEEIENEIGIIHFELLRLTKRLSDLASAVRRPAELAARSRREEVSIQDLCQRVLDARNKEEAAGFRIEGRAELKQVFVAYQRASGKHGARLGQYGSDAGTRALVALFAVGYSVEELCDGIRLVIQGAWWAGLVAEGRNPDISMISPQVLRRAIDRRDPREGRRQQETHRRSSDPFAAPAHRPFEREPEARPAPIAPPPRRVFEALATPRGGVDDSAATSYTPQQRDPRE